MGNLIKLLGILFVILFFAGVGWLAYGSYEYMKNKSKETSAATTEADLSESTDLALAEGSSDMNGEEDEDGDEFVEEDEDLLEDDEVDELLEIDGVLDEIESSVMEVEDAVGETVSSAKDKLSDGAKSLAGAGAATLDKAKAGVSEFTEKTTKASSKPERKDIPTDYEKPINLSPKDLYFVIIGSFTVAENAEKEAKAMRKKGYSKTETIQFASTKYLSVSVGRFNSKAEAKEMVSKIKNELKIDAYVHKRRLK